MVLVVAAQAEPRLTAEGVYASYADVRAALTALAEILPDELKADTLSEADWSRWAARHDRAIRARLERGDDDTLVNWLLLGTTFTTRPRAMLDASSTKVKGPSVAERVSDFVAALGSPGTDERRLFARRVLERKGYNFDTTLDRERVTNYLFTEVARVVDEQAANARDLAEARNLGDVSQEFAARSRLFRLRGLSLDTSLMPGFALERSLGELRARGLVTAGAVRDVAVIGPGLDFSDKSSGYDFYPQQTVQPFALIDSLIRVGLVHDKSALRVTTMDVSPRVNDHLTAMRLRAAAGQPYVIRLPLDFGIGWKSDVIAYWNAAGDRIGAVTQTNMREAALDLRVRTLTVRPDVALQFHSEDLNIVVQRLRERRFDLIVATNIFIYYDVLDQVLALSNIEAMLRPGGFLLSNNALLELPSSRLRSVGYLTVQYSDRSDDGDHIVWYQAK